MAPDLRMCHYGLTPSGQTYMNCPRMLTARECVLRFQGGYIVPPQCCAWYRIGCEGFPVPPYFT
jgi:hypothetical protein